MNKEIWSYDFVNGNPKRRWAIYKCGKIVGEFEKQEDAKNATKRLNTAEAKDKRILELKAKNKALEERVVALENIARLSGLYIGMSSLNRCLCKLETEDGEYCHMCRTEMFLTEALKNKTKEG